MCFFSHVWSRPLSVSRPSVHPFVPLSCRIDLNQTFRVSLISQNIPSPPKYSSSKNHQYYCCSAAGRFNSCPYFLIFFEHQANSYR